MVKESDLVETVSVTVKRDSSCNHAHGFIGVLVVEDRIRCCRQCLGRIWGGVDLLERSRLIQGTNNLACCLDSPEATMDRFVEGVTKLSAQSKTTESCKCLLQIALDSCGGGLKEAADAGTWLAAGAGCLVHGKSVKITCVSFSHYHE
jgi:hypothetical protein